MLVFGIDEQLICASSSPDFLLEPTLKRIRFTQVEVRRGAKACTGPVWDLPFCVDKGAGGATCGSAEEKGRGEERQIWGQAEGREAGEAVSSDW